MGNRFFYNMPPTVAIERLNEFDEEVQLAAGAIVEASAAAAAATVKAAEADASAAAAAGSAATASGSAASADIKAGEAASSASSAVAKADEASASATAATASAALAAAKAADAASDATAASLKAGEVIASASAAASSASVADGKSAEASASAAAAAASAAAAAASAGNAHSDAIGILNNIGDAEQILAGAQLTAAEINANIAGAAASAAAAQISAAAAADSAAVASADAAAAQADAIAAAGSAAFASSEADRAQEAADLVTAGQIQSDWGQADSTQRDFIKNKPDVVLRGELNAPNGVAGLDASFRAKLKNAAGAITSLLGSLATVTRTWSLPDASGTLALLTDITKGTIGLPNVDNTSDANKPVSAAAQAALNLKANLASPLFTGTVSTDGDFKGPVLSLNFDRLENHAHDLDTANVAISFNGYAGGTTRYRNFIVCDGKQAPIMFLTGSSKLASFTGSVAVSQNLTVTGNLTVNGTTTTVNSTTLTVDDPIVTLGGDTAPVSDDAKDRGVEMRYYAAGAARLAFMGYDSSSGRFSFLTSATNTGEVFTGSKGTLDANLAGDVSGNLMGNVTGNVSGTAANVTGTVAIANGGTGATTAAAAASSLGLGSASVPVFSGAVLSSAYPNLRFQETDAVSGERFARIDFTGGVMKVQRLGDDGVTWTSDMLSLSLAGVLGISTVNAAALNGNALALTAAAPAIRFTESDMAGSLGAWRQVLDNDVLRIDRNTAAAKDFSTFATALRLDAGSVILGAPLVGPVLRGEASQHVDKGTVSSGTVTFDYRTGISQRVQAGGPLTIAFDQWPAGSDQRAFLMIEVVNGNTGAITMPAIQWVLPDGSKTSSMASYMAAIGRTALQSSGSDFFVFWKIGSASEIYGKMV